MAETAGIVNTVGREEDTAFLGLLSAASPALREVAVAVRDLVYDVYPQTVEVVWPRQKSVGWGIGPKKLTEQFAYLLPFTKHVALGFYYGGDLPDPAGLLPDSGGRQDSGRMSMRSLKLASLDDVGRAPVRALVAAAVAERQAAASTD